MWIIDSCYRDGCVEIWEKGEGQAIRRRKEPYQPGFDLHLPDPHQVPGNCWRHSGSSMGRRNVSSARCTGSCPGTMSVPGGMWRMP